MNTSILKLLFLSLAMTLLGCSFSPDHIASLAITGVAPRENTPRLGDAEIRFEKTYGKPVSVRKNGFKDYSSGQLKIEVHYANGVAESILYAAFKGQPLDDYWVSRVLSLNSQGKAWVVKRDSKSDDIWYRTTDCKLLANFNKQRILVVSTRHFRQWLWDQAGKGQLPPEQSKTSIFYPDCGCVFIGESESRMTYLLGSPSMQFKNANVRGYRDKDVEIRAQFENGRCEAIKYISKKGKLSDHWVSATLALNSVGLAWVVDEKLKRGDKRFVTINGKLHAGLLRKGHALLIYTEELNQKTLKRLNAKEAPIKSAIESQAASIAGN